MHVRTYISVMDRITATATAVNRNRNRDTVVSTATVTAVIFFNNRVYLKKCIQEKVYFTYFEVRIEINYVIATYYFFL